MKLHQHSQDTWNFIPSYIKSNKTILNITHSKRDIRGCFFLLIRFFEILSLCKLLHSSPSTFLLSDSSSYFQQWTVYWDAKLAASILNPARFMAASHEEKNYRPSTEVRWLIHFAFTAANKIGEIKTSSILQLIIIV